MEYRSSTTTALLLVLLRQSVKVYDLADCKPCSLPFFFPFFTFLLLAELC